MINPSYAQEETKSQIVHSNLLMRVSLH